MFRNFFKITFRSLLQYKGASFLNLFGLATGLTASLLIFMWIQDELSYEKMYTDYEQIYRVEEDQFYGKGPYHVNVTPYPTGPEWEKRLPEVSNACRYNGLPKLLVEKDDIMYYETAVKTADSSFFEFFDYKFKYGGPSEALTNPHSIVLSEELAQKYFGDENPLGKSLTIEKQMSFMVTGVLEDLPRNTILRFDAIIPMSFLYEIGVASDSWGNNTLSTYLKVQPGTDLEALNGKLTAIVREHLTESTTEFMVAPFHRIHLHSYFGYKKSIGSVIFIYIFGAIAFFVLLIASINYVNLATARSTKRAKEIGIKKANGERKSNLIIQFLLESVLQVFISLLIALILVGLLLNVFNTITGKEFILEDIFQPKLIAGYVLITLFVGLGAGMYPAFLLSSFKTVDIMKGEVSGGSRVGFLRKALVVVQAVLSIFLAVTALIIFQQVRYMRNTDMGYSPQNLAVIPIMELQQGRFDRLKAELERSPLIEKVSGSSLNPVFIGSNSGGIDWEGKDPELHVLVGMNHIEYDYLETMGIQIKDGRDFSPEFTGDMRNDSLGNFLINEEMARIMDKEDPVGCRFEFQRAEGVVVGVMKNFYYQPASREIEPMAFLCAPKEYYNYILVRFSPSDPAGAQKVLADTWQTLIPEYPLDYTLAEDSIDNMYRSEQRMGDLFRYFTILGILLAAMGLYALSSFTAERKFKEIGIRKVMGASAGNVILKLSGQFLLLIVIALIISFPLAWLYARHYLMDFPNRIQISPVVFAVAGLAALGIAFLTVSFQSYRAANRNPVDAIRVE